MAIIEVKSLTKVYGSDGAETHALRGVDFNVEAGEFTAVAGPSGSGKTTLLNIIGGLDKPTSGSVKLDGKLITEMSASELSELRLRNIGFVFQAYNLVPVLTAIENVEFVMLLRKVPVEERRCRAREMLEEVGLADYINRRPNLMSGGQQQRVAVARAMVGRPRIILADEPTANLDSETGASLLNLMRRLNEKMGITFLFSTHDSMVMEYSRRLVKLADGRIVSEEAHG